MSPRDSVGHELQIIIVYAWFIRFFALYSQRGPPVLFYTRLKPYHQHAFDSLNFECSMAEGVTAWIK